jgi:cob(I)alamin adenosyltransferase
MEKGYIQIYTGNGKGKTTASIGLSMRALGSGMRVFFGQFMKKGYSAEQAVFGAYPELATLRQYGSGKFIMGAPSEEDIALAQNGWQEGIAAFTSGDYDVVVLDELNSAIALGLVSLDEVLEALQKKAEGTEVIITGRSAPQALMDVAHLVTEMREIKHYYKIGVPARKGIES